MKKTMALCIAFMLSCMTPVNGMTNAQCGAQAAAIYQNPKVANEPQTQATPPRRNVGKNRKAEREIDLLKHQYHRLQRKLSISEEEGLELQLQKYREVMKYKKKIDEADEQTLRAVQFDPKWRTKIQSINEQYDNYVQRVETPETAAQ